MSALHVQNEIGKLKKVLLHCPGPETRNYPDGQFNRSLRCVRLAAHSILIKPLGSIMLTRRCSSTKGWRFSILKTFLPKPLMRQRKRVALLSIATFQNAARGALSSSLPFASISSASKAPAHWSRQPSTAFATPSLRHEQGGVQPLKADGRRILTRRPSHSPP